jgi:hypothetical protein
VLLVGECVRRKLLVPNANGIILVIPNEQVVGKRRLGIARNHTCGETTVSGFDVPVTVVNADNFEIVKCYHVFLAPSFYFLHLTVSV